MMVFLAQVWAAARQRPGIAACVAVTILAALGNYPLWRQRQVITREHDEIRQRGETMLSALTNRGRINEDLAILTEAQEVIDRNLVSEESMEVNLGYFYRLEKLTRVRLLRIDQLGAAAPAAGSLFKSVPVSLQVFGTYRNLLGFMRELETGPRVLRLRAYRLERTDPGGGELALSLTVELLGQP